MKESSGTSTNSPLEFLEIPTSSPPGRDANLEGCLARGGSRIRNPQNCEARRLSAADRRHLVRSEKNKKAMGPGRGKGCRPDGTGRREDSGQISCGRNSRNQVRAQPSTKNAGCCGSGASAPRCQQPGVCRADFFSNQKQYPAGRSRSLPSFGRRFFFACVPC